MHNWLLYPHTLMEFHGTWTERYLGMGIRHTCDPNLKVILGSSEVIDPNGQDIHNWSLYPHTLMDFYGTWMKEILGSGHTCDPNYFLDIMINCAGYILHIAESKSALFGLCFLIVTIYFTTNKKLII